MNSDHEIADWTVTRWNSMEHDVYFDPDNNTESFDKFLLMAEEYMSKNWSFSVHDLDGYYRKRALFLRKKARLKQLKHRRKIKHKQKRAAFRRRKRGLA